MAAIVQFFVNDTSPAIVYSPFGDTFSTPNTKAGWNPYYSGSGFATAQGVKGVGNSFHITSLDGASFTIAWNGSSIQLQGNVTNASYTITLDGVDVSNPAADIADNVLATITDLPNAPHAVTLTAQILESDPASSIAFGRAIIASTPPNPNPSTLYRLNYLNGSDVAFLGRWSFTSDENTSWHESRTPGDRATTSFQGAAFVLQGMTCPDCGNYSVAVDDQKISYSAKSSFLRHDTLLHYTTGLDPGTTHTVVVTHEGGGVISLLEGGFGVYSSGSPLPPSASPSPTPIPEPVSSTSYPKGTIAAFVLAGCLAFFLISGTLYFFFIYRPRKKFQLERERWRTSGVYNASKAQEAGEVLDIAQNPPTSGVAEEGMQFASPSTRRQSRRAKHDSGMSSFTRWKREVENGRPRDSLGIQFRHSDSFDEKNEPRGQYDQGTIQSSSERTSSRAASFFGQAKWMRTLGLMPAESSVAARKAKGKQKGKESRRVSDDLSWSPSYQINLPFQPPSGEQTAPPRNPSTVGGLSYLTANIEMTPGASEGLGGAPPSYAASISHRESESPPSVPRSVTHSSSGPTVQPAPAVIISRFASEDKSPVTSYTSSLTPPYPVRDLSKEDRGSLMDQSIDETPGLLAGTAVRQLIRSLSPRTSKASFPTRHNALSMEMTSIPPASPTIQDTTPRPPPQQPRNSRPLPVPPSPGLPSPVRSEYSEQYGGQSEPVSPTTEESPPPPRSGLPRSSGTFGPPRSSWAPTLAPQAEASTSSNTRPSSTTPISEVPFPSARPSEHPARFSRRMSNLISRPESAQGSSRTPVHITPATPVPFPTLASKLGFSDTSEAGTRHSFLDMTQSSDVSAYSLSKGETTDTSSLNNDTTRYSTPQGQPPEERSRWSSSNDGQYSTNQPENDNGSSGQGNGSGNESSGKSSKSGARSNPPTQLTVPPASQFLSPHRHARFSVSGSSTISDPVHVHPPFENLESPTDSIPVDAKSDVDFRVSDSEEIPMASRLLGSPEGSASVRTSGSSGLYPFTRQANVLGGEFAGGLQDPLQTPLGPASPGYLVQRVLGLHSSGVSPGHSRAGSSSTPFSTTGRSGSQLRHGTTGEVTERDDSRGRTSPRSSKDKDSS
ncbi:hypothetical protein FA13DRAFT_1705486 [Coprinellus micaceus]|uniref:Transmembrane protein n=1 Tax=Coprinellus micaceus TaxID=71717 RepID=A0A4Y7TSP4_COPMI|nr:hypothetical protein FA13DRAFT_1705486 [Coprinellus micaceus]